MTDEDYETFRERLQLHLATLGGAKQEEQVLLDTQIAELEGKREKPCSRRSRTATTRR